MPASSVLDSSSRIRCYTIARKLADRATIEVLTLHGDPWTPRVRMSEWLLNFVRLLSIARNSAVQTKLFVQRGESVAKALALTFARRLTKCVVVFDFDDSIFLTSRLATRIMCQNADAIIVSTRYLADYARVHNPETYVVPTSIDLRVYSRTARGNNERPVIGWIGSPSNLKYLKILKEPLIALHQRHDYVFRIVTDLRYKDQVPLGTDVPYELVAWSLDNFVQILSTFDIGVAPLSDDAWTRGKSGYKILEYMAMGIPAVASKVEGNYGIFRDGFDGFLAEGCDEWVERLDILLTRPELREALGRAGRKRVEQDFSMDLIASRIGDLLAKLHYSDRRVRQQQGAET